jgi:hypothetical protein
MRLWLGVTGAKLVLSSQNLMLILSSLEAIPESDLNGFFSK